MKPILLSTTYYDLRVCCRFAYEGDEWDCWAYLSDVSANPDEMVRKLSDRVVEGKKYFCTSDTAKTRGDK